MIVTSSALILTPDPGFDLNSPFIGWQNLVRYEGVTADSEDPLFPAVNLSRDATTYKWKSLSTATQYVTVDTSPDDPVDYFGIARHNFGSGKIKVSGEAFISGVWTEIFSESLPGNDSPLLFRFPIVLTAETFRVKLQPTVGVAPTMAVLFIGQLLYLQRKIYVNHTPLPYGRDVDFLNGVAENGDFQGRIELRQRLETSVGLSNLTPSWYRDHMDEFISLGRKRAFFFGWRPYTYPKEVGYAWLTNNPKPVNQRSNGMMQISLNLGGLVV